MVESQVRPSDITDRHLMRAMQDIPREMFVPEASRSIAYADEDVVVGAGSGRSRRALLAPRTLSKLIQAAMVQSGERVLDVGCATGYSTAVLARLAGSAIGLEEDPALAAAARSALESVKATNARVEQGPLKQGWAAGGLYDVIILNGSVPQVPQSLMEQLSDGGRLVAIVATVNGFGTARITTRTGAGFTSRVVFDAGAPQLPGFEMRREFAL